MSTMDPVACPFPIELLTKHVGLDGLTLTQVEIARCLAARRFPPRRTVGRRMLVCLPASTAPPEGMRVAHPVRARHHIEVIVAGRRVHIETVEQDLACPGGTNKEARVYVDGLLEGRSVLLGRLGATVNTFPAIARIAREVAITVVPVRWASLRELMIEIKEDER